MWLHQSTSASFSCWQVDFHSLPPARPPASPNGCPHALAMAPPPGVARYWLTLCPPPVGLRSSEGLRGGARLARHHVSALADWEPTKWAQTGLAPAVQVSLVASLLGQVKSALSLAASRSSSWIDYSKVLSKGRRSGGVRAFAGQSQNCW